MEFTVGASRGVIVGCRVLDADKESKPLELWLFRSSISGTGLSDNNTFNPHDTDHLPHLIGVLSISDWFNADQNSIGQAENLPLAFADLSLNKIYGWLVTRGLPTYTNATDLKVELEVLPG